MSNKNDHDTYIIPPNFIETGTFFGGMFRARNVIEAGILVFAIGAPVFLFLPFGLTTRIIILCLTALPVGLVALIGISGESLSQFLVIFLKYLRNRRVVGGDGAQPEEKAAPSKSAGKHLKQRPPKEKKPKAPKRRRSGEADFPAEFDEVRGYEIREKLRPKKKAKKERPAKANKAKKKAKKRPEKERLPRRPAHIKEQKLACLNPVADYLPIEKVENGIIYTKDHRFVKVVEVVPINFMLRSAREQRNIIYSFVSYLKISPIKLQIKVLTRRADINRHLDTVRQEMAHEENEQCRLMQEDYLNFVQHVGSREAVTRRFFLILSMSPGPIPGGQSRKMKRSSPSRAPSIRPPTICASVGMRSSSLKMRMSLPLMSSIICCAGTRAPSSRCRCGRRRWWRSIWSMAGKVRSIISRRRSLPPPGALIFPMDAISAWMDCTMPIC